MGRFILGRDTHALSEPAFYVALEVLAPMAFNTMVDAGGGFTPTPGLACHLAQQAAHQRPGGWYRHHAVAQSAPGWRLQIQSADGGPAGSDVTAWIEKPPMNC